MLFKSSLNILFLALLLATLISCEEKHNDLEDGIYAEFITSKGTMMAKLAYNKTPVTVANFVSLAEGTNSLVKDPYKKKAYFNGTIFHRVIANSIIQGGDPTGKGSGNPGYKFKDEFHPDLKHNKKGILSMANYGPNTNGSQFFITIVPKPNLDNKHSVFGQLVSGFDVLDSISVVKTDKNDRPFNDVVITELNILRIGKAAKKFNAPKIFKSHFIKEQQLKKEQKAKAEATLKATFKRFENQKTKAKTLDSGLQYYISKAGDGEKLHENAQALVHYTVYTENGDFIKTSKLEVAKALNVVDINHINLNKYQPIVADIGPDAQMIPGFKEGLQQLHVGDIATLFIPYHLGFGEAGGNTVPGKTNIIFEVEVLKLLK